MQTASISGGLILLAGEAGIGKSRLLAELLAAPDASALRQLHVACLEPDRTQPYALILEIVRAAGGRTSELLAGRMSEAERQVRRVQEVLRDILNRASGGCPLVLAAEDLHWSDEPSLNVLLGLAQRLDRLVLALTYRLEAQSAALAGFLAEVNRLRMGHAIALQPLNRTDVARMVRAILELDRPVSGAFLDELMAATDGNPFLVEEVLRALVDGGELEWNGSGWRRRPGPLRVPGSLRQAIDARLLRQPADVVHVAELAAVVGRVVAIGLLRRLSGLDERGVLAALRALTECQVLRASPSGELTFRHALIREGVLARLLKPERRLLHRRVAEVLGTESGTAPAILAYHWSQAGEAATAAPYALQAAEQASALHAHREAIGHYEVALAGGAGPTAELLVALGDHHEALSESDAAIARYQEAGTLGAGAGDTTAIARMHLRIGVAYAHERRRSEALENLTKAFSGLPNHHPERWRTGLQLALQLAAVGNYEQAEATLEETLRCAGHESALARLRINYELGGLRAVRGDWTALDAAALLAVGEVQEESDEALALRHDAHAALGTVGYYRGAFDVSLEHFTACLGIAEQRGLTSDQALAHWNRATNALYNLGRWREARAGLADLQALGASMLSECAEWFEQWLDGRWEEAAKAWLHAWSHFMQPSGDLEVYAAHGRRIADILLALGRAQEAHSLLVPALERIRAARAHSFELQLVPREVEALARLGDPRTATVCEAGLELARKLGGRPAEALLIRGRALAFRASGLWAEAFADFEAAQELLNALPMSYEAARTMRETGLARLARGRRGDRERGAHALQSARRLFADLGATRDEAATGGILSAAGLASRAERGPGPLSVREHEVAELVAQGLSNRDIAGRLFITEKTAAFHVGAVLNKLGFNSRAQIAAYVARHEARGSRPL